MKQLFLLVLVGAFIASCSCEADEKTDVDYYLNTDFLLVKKTELPSDDEPYMEFIIRTQTKPYLYRTIDNSCGGGPYMDRETFHKYNVGDLLHYDYLLRSEFFTMTQDIILDSEKSEVEKYIESTSTSNSVIEDTVKSYEPTFTEPNF